MAAMRCRFAQVAILLTASFLAGQQAIRAQEAVPTATSDTSGKSPCPSFTASENKPTARPEVSIDRVTFSGALRLPSSDQDRIADSIHLKARGDSVDGLLDGALEWARAGWQNHGYFKVLVSGDLKPLTDNPTRQRFALNVHVDEGLQYTLGNITFRNNKAIADVNLLRSLFPVKNGKTFSREKIAKGLENLRKAYQELGYINFVGVPDTRFDDEKRQIFLEIDLDEGKQFYVSSLDVLGVDEPARLELLKEFPIGQIYNGRILEQFVEQHPILNFHPDEPGRIVKRLDERMGEVAITLDARPCLAD